MAEAGRILREVLQKTADAAGVGVALRYLDSFAEGMIRSAGAEPAFLGYKPYGAVRPYPATICSSVNDIVVHGLPTTYKLRNSDLLKIDLGVKLNGYYADAAVTVPIGQVTGEARKLIEATRKSLILGIKQMKPGNHLGDIGYAVDKYVRSRGFRAVQGLTGHGIGTALHEDPSVFNEGKAGSGIELRPGMVLAIEPMICAGSPKVVQLPDDSYATEDGSLSAHFEHTVAITETGPEILT